jgi:hypothetical protein
LEELKLLFERKLLEAIEGGRGQGAEGRRPQ